ncbi:mannitol 1-phosphate dehydrogenase [Aspergillus venezuelensis]
MTTTPQPTPYPCKLAIIGAGIGGLALAIGLQKLNVPVTIYESAPQFDAIGAGIGLGPNALRAMELMDKTFASRYDAIKVCNTTPAKRNEQFEILSAGKGFGLNSGSGSEAGWRGGSVGHRDFYRSSAHRKDLLEVMKGLILQGTVRFNKRIVRIEEDGHGHSGMVTLVFADGETATVDAVVGCDGIKGFTRQVVLDPEYPSEVRAKYANTYVYRQIVSMDTAKDILGEYALDAKWYMSKGKGMATYPISQGKEVNMVVFIRDPNPWAGEQAAREVPREDMLADLEGFDGRLLRVLENAKSVRWPLFHHPDTPTYYRGRICLLGDAAHASSPSQAAGAGQGLEDALILSHVLSLVESPNQLEAASQVYDSIRRPRAQAVVQQSHEVMQAYFLEHPDFGNNLQKLTDDANERLPLIWWHDLEADLSLAEERFKSRTASSGGISGRDSSALKQEQFYPAS